MTRKYLKPITKSLGEILENREDYLIDKSLRLVKRYLDSAYNSGNIQNIDNAEATMYRFIEIAESGQLEKLVKGFQKEQQPTASTKRYRRTRLTKELYGNALAEKLTIRDLEKKYIFTPAQLTAFQWRHGSLKE